jgi:hypothetical protein
MGEGGVEADQGRAMSPRERLVLVALCLIAVAAFAVAASLPR